MREMSVRCLSEQEKRMQGLIKIRMSSDRRVLLALDALFPTLRSLSFPWALGAEA